MRYLNKDGKEVSRDAWRDLFKNNRYSVLRRDFVNNVLVETSWVGVVGDREPEPKIFLTKTVKVGASKKGNKASEPRDGEMTITHLPDLWTSTATQAVEAHAERMRTIGGG